MRHVTRNSHRWMIYICNATNVVFNIFLVFAIIFRCTPVSFFWNRVERKGTGVCREGVSIRSTYLQSGISAAIDITFATLPMFFIADLGFKKMQNAALGAVLLLSEL
jgi:hypothetical protein